MVRTCLARASAVVLLAGCAGAPADGQSPETWYVESNASTVYLTSVTGMPEWRRVPGERLTLRITGEGAGTVATADRVDRVDAIEEHEGWLTLRRWLPDGAFEHWRAYVAEGTLAGRIARTSTPTAPTLTDYDRFLTGWNERTFPLDGPLSWDLVVDDHLRARLRLDRMAAGAGFVGRYKVYADDRLDTPSDGEELEYDATDVAFDGGALTFTRRDPVVGWSETFSAAVSGRTIDGQWTLKDGTVAAFRGTRASLFGYGLVPRADRTAWQALTRTRIENLAMAGNPTPLACVPTLGTAMPPVFDSSPWSRDQLLYAARDDDAASWPQAYVLRELSLHCTLQGRWDGRTLARDIHGWVAIPTAAVRGRGHSAVVALNGHGGTAHDVMTPSSQFWYGDSFARRGYVVVAIDVKHHPEEEVVGEDGSHPPVSAEWEEDGERAWDVMRALDWLVAQPDIDPARVRVTGLSMGGEVTTIAGALDARFEEVVPAGWSPDTDLLTAFGSHGCWLWKHGDLREYYDQSDLHALVAPRPLLVLTGRLDPNYSSRVPTFSHELSLVRRSRVAYAGDDARIQHYLHDGAHDYRVGAAPEAQMGPGPGVVVTLAAPSLALDPMWQTVDATVPYAPTLFGALRELASGDHVTRRTRVHLDLGVSAGP
jgi:hypothetical protein